MYNTAWFSQPQRRRVHLFPTLHLVFPSWPRACHPLPGRRNSVFPGFWFLSSFLRFERFLGRGVAVLVLPASSHSSEVLWIETAGHSRPPLPHLGGSVLFLAPLGILASRRPIAAFRWCGLYLPALPGKVRSEGSGARAHSHAGFASAYARRPVGVHQHRRHRGGARVPAGPRPLGVRRHGGT
jgi:hypothetical protein